MTDTSTKRARPWWKYFLIASALAAVTGLGLFLYINTESFQSLVRRRLVAEVERITGGRVEIGSIHTTPFRLQVDVRGITVHGRESANEAPLAHIDRIVARLKISSLLRSELAFEELILEQPAVHVAFYPDGSTNFPPRKVKVPSGQTAVEQLFSLSINQFELRHGQILWDDQLIPLDFAARDTSLNMEYSFLRNRYDGHLLLGLVDTKLLNYRPFAWMTTVEFSLGPNSAVIPSIKWNSGHSHFSVSGQVTDFRHPHVQGTYEAQLDLSEAASIARYRDLRGGELELKGHGEWELDKFSSDGFVAFRDFAWQDEQVAFSKASVTSGYSVTDQELKLSKLQGRIFGGGFTGEAEIDQWLAPEQHFSPAMRKTMETAVISAGRPLSKSREKAAPSKSPAVQNASIVLHLRDISAEEVAAAFSSVRRSFSGVHPAASASGTLETRWRGSSHDAETRFVLDLVPPSRPLAAQLPVTAHTQGVYFAADQSWNLGQFTLSTPTTRVQASGILSSASALHLSVSTSSVSDWLPVVAAVRGPALFPVVLNGSAIFNGIITGSSASPQLAGSVRINDFEVNLPATAKTRAIRTQWDSLVGSLQLSFQAISLRNAALRRGDTSADFDASASLNHGHFVGDSAFTLRGNLRNFSLADLQAFAGYNLPISGNADISLQAAGTFSNPHSDGHIHLTEGSAYGEAVQQFDSNFRIANGEFAFDGLRLSHDDALVTGNAAYTPTTRGFRLDVAGNNFDLAQVSQLQSRHVPVEGRIDFVLKGTGTPDAPSIDADAHIRNLALNHEPAGDFFMQGVSRGSELQVRGNSQFQRGALQLSGSVQLRDGYPANLSFAMDQLDLDALWRAYFHDQLTGHSAVDGAVALRGPLRYPGQWKLDGSLTGLSLDIANVKLHNQDPIRLSFGNQSLSIQQLHLLGDGTDLTARGSIPFSDRQDIDLTASGRFDLKLLSTFNPAFTSSGVVTMDMTVGGTIGDPLPQGHLQISGGAVAYAGLPSGLTDLNGSLMFTRDHVHIETLNAHTGGGALDLVGDATYLKRQLNFNLTATGKDVRLRYPAGVSSTADAELHWVGTRSASTLSGDISVNKIAVTPGFDFSTYLDRSRQFSSVTVANSPLYNVKLDIHVVTSPDLQMRTAIARLSGDADLHIRGSLARPAVLGRADILEGQATFHGTRYTLERGDITFANPVAIEPQLNLQASTHVRNYDLSITVTGTPDRGLNIN